MPTRYRDISIHLFLTAGLQASALAQSSVKLEFITPPDRTVVSEPLRELVSPTPCTIVVDLTINRNGLVSRSTADKALSTCVDAALITKAEAHAKGYSFAPKDQGPSAQHVRLTWVVEPLRIEERETLPTEGLEEAPSEGLAGEASEVFINVEEAPSFPGGEQAMYTYLRNHVRYPEMERESGIQGKVYVRFVVERDGRIEQVEVARSVSPGLDRVAMNAVRNMPKWNPGKVQGKAVRVQYILPVSFTLK